MKINADIYILEPDHATRVELRSMLEDHFINIFTFTKGVDFLTAIDNSNSATCVVIISSKLLYMNTTDVINRIKEKPGFKMVPILQIGSEAELSEKIMGTIDKPFGQSTIKTINEALSTKPDSSGNS